MDDTKTIGRPPARGVAMTLGQRFATACIVVSLPVFALAFALSGTAIGAALSFLTFLAMAATAAIAMKRHYPHDRLGVANLVTLGRTGLVSALFAPLAVPGMLADSGTAWTVLAIAIVSLCLDGVDGFFARRQGLVSAFGARFDMEVDSIFALLLAVLSWQSGKAGVWVLALGGMRYLFLAAAVFFPWLMAPLPERFSRKAICVIQIGVLIALLAPIVDGPLSWSLAAIGTALLVYSFGRDVVWLLRHR